VNGLLLAIEMSQRGGSVAIGPVGGTPVQRTFAAGSRDDDLLMPTLDALVQTQRATPADISAVAVSVGPGGFTGLRIAVTAAKCIAEMCAVPLIAVPSALVAAHAAQAPGPWLVALASKRDTAWLTMVCGVGGVAGARGDLRVVGVPATVRAAELQFESPDGASFRTLLADEHVPCDLVDQARSAGLIVEAPVFAADACWHVGACMYVRGQFVDPPQLAPIYPREPEAVTVWRARH